ncbi:c-type cytochrome biogenesis protein CcmI, partial [Gemmobacter sp.]|uniref:c-type cytochrome biogenesis protein CcmI n=1 Tax=Gemmobacter sp. TaxID=1898957 RepID=UPI003454657B
MPFPSPDGSAGPHGRWRKPNSVSWMSCSRGQIGSGRAAIALPPVMPQAPKCSAAHSGTMGKIATWAARRVDLRQKPQGAATPRPFCAPPGTATWGRNGKGQDAMAIFWLTAGALVLASAVAMVLGAIRGPRALEAAGADVQVYRDQLAEVERD